MNPWSRNMEKTSKSKIKILIRKGTFRWHMLYNFITDIEATELQDK